MSKISIEEVRNFLEGNNWELLSEKYVNLDTDLEVKCSQGHIISLPYKTLRKHCICPICAKEGAQVAQIFEQPKTSDFRILALDQATLISGWSLWDKNKIVGYGTFTADEHLPTVERLTQIKQWLEQMVEKNKPDLVLLEDIQLQEFYDNNKNKTQKYDNVGITTFKVLAKLQGVLEVTLNELNVDYKIVHSATWRSALGVKGRTRVDKKRSAQLLIKKQYNLIATEDEADAICIGWYGAENYGFKIEVFQW